MPTKLEDALSALKSENSDNPTMVQLIELVVAQNEQIKNLQQYHLETKHRLGALEKTQAEHDQSIASLTKTRDETTSKVAAIESKPANDTKRLDELDKRVTTVEGAVGSKAFKKAEKAEADKPATPSINPFKAAIVSTPPAPEFQPMP
jgi:septal ring factor EnvC (AmiA/AmiB activator)